MTPLNTLTNKYLCLAAFLTSPIVLTQAYVIGAPNALAVQALPPNRPMSSLASKVIYESPSMSNVYKEYIVTSKPVTLRKYGNSKKKMKKTKTDSKIYFIQMPPMPYRYIPGVGYDYQPMKIKPIMMEAPIVNHNEQMVPVQSNSYPTQGSLHKHKHKQTTTTSSPLYSEATEPSFLKPHSQHTSSATGTITTSRPTDSRIVRLNIGKNVYYNGRLVRLQAAHASPKNHITPDNLKSKFYYDKPLIY